MRGLRRTLACLLGEIGGLFLQLAYLVGGLQAIDGHKNFSDEAFTVKRRQKENRG